MKTSHVLVSVLLATLLLILGISLSYAMSDGMSVVPSPSSTPFTVLVSVSGLDEDPIAWQGQEESPTPAAGQEGDQPMPSDDVAAIVNGESITKAAYQGQMKLARWALESQGNDLSTEEGKLMLKTLRQQVLEDMVNMVIIEQAAASEGITVTQKMVNQTVDKTIEDGGGRPGFEQWLKDTGQTEDDYSNMIRSQLTTEAIGEKIVGSLPDEAPQVHARHILVDSEEKALDVIKKLQNGGDFVALAKELSLDQATKDQGGNLGWFPRQLMPPEIDNLVFSADVGLIGEPIPDAFGTFHVLEIVEKDPQRKLTEEQINSLKNAAFMQWLAQQRLDAQVERLMKF